MKRVLALLLCLVLFAGCSQGEKKKTQPLTEAETAAPCERFITPTKVMQTDFLPEARSLYRGEVTWPAGEGTATFDALLVTGENSNRIAVYRLTGSETPLYFDEGRWMALPTMEMRRLLLGSDEFGY